MWPVGSRISRERLEPRVLHLQFLETLGVVDPHAVVAGMPPMTTGLRDIQRSTNRGGVFTVALPLIRLTHQSRDLLRGRLSPSRRNAHPLEGSAGNQDCLQDLTAEKG